MPTLTSNDVALLAQIKKRGAAIYNSDLDGGQLLIGTDTYTRRNNPDALNAFQRFKDHGYIISEYGIVFTVTEAGKHRLLSLGP